MGTQSSKEETVIVQGNDGNSKVTNDSTSLILSSLCTGVIILALFVVCCIGAAKLFKKKIVKDIKLEAVRECNRI